MKRVDALMLDVANEFQTEGHPALEKINDNLFIVNDQTKVFLLQGATPENYEKIMVDAQTYLTKRYGDPNVS